MGKITEHETTVVSKVTLELSLDEAQGLHELLWRGVGSGTLAELGLQSLAHDLHGHTNLHGSYRLFIESAQI